MTNIHAIVQLGPIDFSFLMAMIVISHLSLMISVRGIQSSGVEGIKGAHSKAVYGHNNIGLRKDFMKQNPTASP